MALDYFDTAHLRIIIRSELQGDNLLESNFMSLIITLYEDKSSLSSGHKGVTDFGHLRILGNLDVTV